MHITELNCHVSGEIQKELSEYKLKLKRAEQEITSLEGNVCIAQLAYLNLNFFHVSAQNWLKLQ